MSDIEQEYQDELNKISQEEIGPNKVQVMKDGKSEWVDADELKQPDPPPATGKAVMVSINKSGVMGFKNQIELSQAGQLAMKLKMAPDHLIKAGLEAVMAALTLCRQLNLPVSALNEMGHIKGKITCYGSLTTALCEKHPEYGEHRIYWITGEQEIICLANKNMKDAPWACVIQSRKKNSQEWVEFSFSVDEAKQAGLLTSSTKADSAWIKYVKDMLFHKAKNRMQRTQYASALIGVIHHEAALYDEKILTEPRDVGPGINDVLNLNKQPDPHLTPDEHG